MKDFTNKNNNISLRTIVARRHLLRIMFLFLSFFLITKYGNSQSNTGWLSPSTNPYYANVTYPARVYASDNSRAEFTSTNDIADFGGFNFNIPSGSLIIGIEVQIEGYRDDNRQLEAVSLSWNNGTNFSNSIPLNTFNQSGWFNNNESYVQIAINDWGRTWSADDFSNDNFRIRLDATFASGTLYIDHVQVRVWYFEMTSPFPFQHRERIHLQYLKGSIASR